MAEDADIVVARVVKPHGIRGEVVVESFSDVPGRFEPGVEVTVAGVARTIASSRPHQGRLLVAFEGLADRNAAELLRGHEVTAPAASVDDSDVYYAHELVGMDVVTEAGEHLGTVVEVIELPAVAGYDLLEVDAGTQRWLLPSDDDLVEVATSADTGQDVLVVVDAPAGLLPGDDEHAAVVEGDDPDPAVGDDAADRGR